MALPQEVERDRELKLSTPVAGFLTSVRFTSDGLTARIFLDALGRHDDGEHVSLGSVQTAFDMGVFLAITPDDHRYVVSSHLWRIPQADDGATHFIAVEVPSPRY